MAYFNSLSEVESQQIKWLWYPFIPYGKLSIVQGDPGDGKSTLILNIAAKLSRGECIDENMNITEPVNVIYQTAEDGLADTVKPRLEAANADCSRISIIDEVLGGMVPKASKLEMAKQFLREQAERTQKILSTEIIELAAQEGISKRTLETAKKELKIKAERCNNNWYWNLRA